MSVVLLFNKPFRVLTQFTSPDGKATLRDFVRHPECVRRGGSTMTAKDWCCSREGALQTKLADPRWKAAKTYLVQVEGGAGGRRARQVCVAASR